MQNDHLRNFNGLNHRMMDQGSLFLLGAFILDFLLGDPGRLPHPIRWMGRGIEILEPRFRRLPTSLVRSGALMTLLMVGVTYLLTFFLLFLAACIHPLLKKSIYIILIYYAISSEALDRSAREVMIPLLKGDLAMAREKVGLIVGRDTKRLTASGVRRAAVETVAENFVDGVAAPLFYAAIGGAPLAMAYKMVNTLDSMIGYKNERYILFGKAAARLDDGANYLPARLTIPVIALAAHMLGRSGRQAFITAVTEGRQHSSPNAGFPEAAFAGALGVRLNGPAEYGGIRVEKPFIGIAFGAVETSDIGRACELMRLSSVLWLGVLIFARIGAGIFF